MTSDISRSQIRAGSNIRYHELDALRATAMLLGIVLHSAVFLIPGVWDTAYPDESSDFYATLFFAIHGFRMPVFFLLSGIFTAMLWRRRCAQRKADAGRLSASDIDVQKRSWRVRRPQTNLTQIRWDQRQAYPTLHLL